jgi:hypothetical protein
MEKAALQQYLTQAEDFIDSARLRIERQTRLLTELRADGHNTANAECLLAGFKTTLEAMEADRDLIEDLLRSARK